MIPATVQPPYFLYLEVDPEEIDVNVHPQKTEVKFTNGAAVWQIINAAVRETLAKSGAVPMMDFDSEERLEIPVLRDSGTGYPTLREPAEVRERDYNPFTQYDNVTSPPPASGDRPSFAAREFPAYETSEFEFIRSAADDAQGTFTELAGPRVFSAHINIGEGYVAALYGGVFV